MYLRKLLACLPDSGSVDEGHDLGHVAQNRPEVKGGVSLKDAVQKDVFVNIVLKGIETVHQIGDADRERLSGTARQKTNISNALGILNCVRRLQKKIAFMCVLYMCG